MFRGNNAAPGRIGGTARIYKVGSITEPVLPNVLSANLTYWKPVPDINIYYDPTPAIAKRVRDVDSEVRSSTVYGQYPAVWSGAFATIPPLLKFDGVKPYLKFRAAAPDQFYSTTIIPQPNPQILVGCRWRCVGSPTNPQISLLLGNAGADGIAFANWTGDKRYVLHGGIVWHDSLTVMGDAWEDWVYYNDGDAYCALWINKVLVSFFARNEVRPYTTAFGIHSATRDLDMDVGAICIGVGGAATQADVDAMTDWMRE